MGMFLVIFCVERKQSETEVFLYYRSENSEHCQR